MYSPNKLIVKYANCTSCMTFKPFDISIVAFHDTEPDKNMKHVKVSRSPVSLLLSVVLPWIAETRAKALLSALLPKK